MKKRRLIPVLCAAAVTASLAGYSGNSGFTTEKGADTQAPKAEAGAETGKEENGGEKKEEAGASKDKKLIIYSPPTESMVDSMLVVFEEDADVNAECLAMSTDDALKRIQAEADGPQANILWSGITGTVRNESECFADYAASNEDAFYDEYENTEGSPTHFDTIPPVTMVNTDLIDDIKIGGYEDLLNPGLKGKIVLADPAASSSSFEHLVNMPYAMGGDDPDNNRDYVEQFCTQLGGELLGGSSTVYRGVADGEYTVGPTLEQGSAQYVGAGAPVKAVYTSESVIFRDDGIYIIKDCLSKSNAQELVDWLISKDVQEFMNSTRYRRTIRRDVEAGDVMVSMNQIKVIQDDETDTTAHKSKWLDEFKELFTE